MYSGLSHGHYRTGLRPHQQGPRGLWWKGLHRRDSNQGHGYRRTTPTRLHAGTDSNVYSVPLTLAQVYAALTFYYDHPEEIEASFREDEEVEAKLKRLNATRSWVADLLS